MNEAQMLEDFNFEMQSCPSSKNIKQVAYDIDEGVLFVEFSYGGKYIYKDVPEEGFSAMMSAESIGSYFSKHIKPNHSFEKVGK